MSRRLALARSSLVGGAALAVAALGLLLVLVLGRGQRREIACGPGFFPRGIRCCTAPSGDCSAPHQGACPRPLELVGPLCGAPDLRVAVPEVEFVVGPSDWEAEGRVVPRTVHTAPFLVDVFEATVGRASCPGCPLEDASMYGAGDHARALGGLSLGEARRYCQARGGRLPTDDEWLALAAGRRPRRYPWGDTGAVCRRAAWGLVEGPCGEGAVGPDTVGSHPDGDSELGVHDAAGNVAERVEDPRGRLRGGAYSTSLATELRTWSSRDVGPGPRPEAGVRCAFDR